MYNTSEKVTVKFALASPFQRIAAYILDMILKWIFIGILVIIMAISGSGLKMFLSKSSTIFDDYFTIGFIVILLLFFFCYNILFEIFMNGQTPGKSILNIRIIMDNGQYVTVYAVIIRNLFRIIDFLPLYYITGIISMFVTKKNQRVGDIVAATIVVCEERIPIPLVEKKITLECVESCENLGEIIGNSTIKAIKNYIAGHSYLAKELKNEVENTLINSIVTKSGITKPATIDNYNFIVSVYNKIFRME